MKKQIINIILLSFFLLGTLGRIAAKDIVFKAGKDFKTLFITKDNVTVNVVKGKGDWGNKNSTYYSFWKNSKLQITSTEDKISKIVFKWKDRQAGPGCITSSLGTYNDNDDEGIWTAGDEKEAINTIDFYMNRIVHIVSITVTIVPESTHIKNTIDENKSSNPITEGISNVTLLRTFHSETWNTLILPFDLSEEQILKAFGKNTKIANYIGAQNQQNGSYSLCFETSNTSIKAGNPVLICGTESKESYQFSSISVVNNDSISTRSGFDFIGTYNVMSLNEGDYFISSDNKIHRANGTETIKPTHAIFRCSIPNCSPNNVYLSINGKTTPIKNIVCQQTSTCNVIYNLSGQRVNANYKGIIIRDGKKKLSPHRD